MRQIALKILYSIGNDDCLRRRRDVDDRGLRKPDYGNWVSQRLIIMFLAAGLGFFGFTFFLWFLAIPSVLLFLVSAYFCYARYQFSPQGGKVQDNIRRLVMEHLGWNGQGRALDIGCGNGALAIELAKKFSGARVVSVDFWGKQWEYSKDTCERNAQLEGVAERVSFQKASASALPFEDDYFDAVVSNLVFHEVSDSADKRNVIREALRLVKKGGKYAFQDLFLNKRVYGEPNDLVATIQSWGIRRVDFVKTRDAEFIPLPLKLPFMVGTLSIIAGEK
jgi:ubiquinone/menaquinone biosynthesis C-methylase UbiE